MEKKATRDAYGQALADLGAEIENLFVLDADLAKATKTIMFKKKYPERFIDCGISEANMMGTAAGLVTCGNVVFASSFAMFAAGRAFEQVRNSIAYPKLNVKIGATHGGISVGEDGASHQCCEDIALMRVLPGMTVINPADYWEAYHATKAAAKMNGPVYLRFGRLAVPMLKDKSYDFQIGKGDLIFDGTDATVIATGLLTGEAVTACEALRQEGISVRLINMHTIKPLDEEIVIRAAQETGLIITAEEHSVIGGLGSAVCEVLAERCPVPVIRIGVRDVFGQSGPAAELLVHYGLTSANIVETVKANLKR